MANPQETCVIDGNTGNAMTGDASQETNATAQEELLRLLNGEEISSPERPFTAKSPAAALTYSEVQEILSLSHKAVKHLVDTNGIPHIRFSEKRVRFPAEAFWTWYRARVKGGGSR